MADKIYDVLIIGGGPAGLTSAIYTSRANLNTLVVAGRPSGGQLINTTDVENYPGFPDGVLGPDLISKFQLQANKFGATFVEANVTGVSGTVKNGFQITTDEELIYSGKTIIVSAGASSLWLGLENEQRLIGRGVSSCATCDGFFFKNVDVAVVGGGDAAMEEALFLTKFATKVFCLVRGTKETMKASKIMLGKALKNPKVEFMFNTQVLDILGQEKVEGIKVLNNINQEQTVLTNIKGVFVAVGHKPNTKFLEGFIELDDLGYIVTKNNTITSKEGVFVAGDVSDRKYRQAITAAGLGCMAAIDVERYLSGGHL
ncbi:thioredoxin-disulfide reductase [candidate division WWE3 bacterium RIFCSPLOWO2_12_FULL_36_10]|uniref:Thioredoxin reductase n=1 Tax=candidate division WWE3 bacterium RIFCSPLOWO2_12_FULL_36_10 TaxID=1802630 RepID=A0A1F4VIL5_UNCKA|nr:MAG: thioredoxin-disulfide reductase [candidate division WWE3 bacterium RIFCSPLOWO2_12_FULL_36_10]